MSNTNTLITELYAIVDQRDAQALSTMLHPNVSFHFSNAEPIRGKDLTTAANAQFFASITSMKHTFTAVYECGETIVCEGQVDYIRLDGTSYDAKFATILTLNEGLIEQYKIFANVSGL